MVMDFGVFLAPLSLYGLYTQWESAGVFDFFLPALLIFALVFGILTTTKILGGNKGVSAIIAIAISLLAIRAPIVTNFFSQIFPNFAIGLAIILVIMILGGLFVGQGNIKGFYNTMLWSGFGLGVVIAIVIFNNNNWYGSFWWQENWTSILWIVIVVLLIMFFMGPSEKDPNAPAFTLPLKALRD